MRKYTWLQRLQDRPDMTAHLIHLTRRTSDEPALHVLTKILDTKTIKAYDLKGTIPGNTPCVCFQETPVIFLRDALITESEIGGSLRYEGYGIRVDKDIVFQSGGRQVIYDTVKTSYFTDPKDRWRFSNIIQSSEKYYIDWSHEREWRIPHDFTFAYKDIDIIVKTKTDRRILIDACIKHNRLDLLTDVRSIIVLEQLFN